MQAEQTDRRFDSTKERIESFSALATRGIIFRVVAIILASLLLFRSTPTPTTIRYAYFSLATLGNGFKLFEWEFDALSAKVQAALLQPSDAIPQTERADVVQAYLERAQEISRIQADLAGRASGLEPVDAAQSTEILTQQVAELRAQQEAVRPAVEQIVQQQVRDALQDAELGIGDFVWPPVQFTFTEPPKKLVVSPRDRIATVYSRMLTPEISLEQIEDTEASINEQRNASAYITDIGGLGAFPTMVVDRASLRWVISTVAHEWVHNYLVFFPLGWNYFASQDMTTVNESVAEIVGNEIGDRVLAEHYGIPVPLVEPAPPPQSEVQPEVPPQPAEFDFRAAMRETRLEVNRLLALGQVQEAEEYMEARRQMFVEEGYPLRVLNQAYFAFHGSYVTSPASTSPIGPKLEHLRSLMPDLETFLQTVRQFTSVDDLDDALMEWEARR